MATRTRKETAWKKSRKFGDVHGGRQWPKVADRIFRRAHSLQRPPAGADLPLLIEENPSRDFFFPLSGTEVLTALGALPKKHTEGLTHVWLRRARKNDYHGRQLPLACFICGSGVRVIVLYPWPADLKLRMGKRKPLQRIQRQYDDYSELRYEGTEWVFVFEEAALRRFYIQQLLYLEVGHHLDWYHRHWSRANNREVEEFAEQYAMSKTATATYVYNALEKQHDDDVSSG